MLLPTSVLVNVAVHLPSTFSQMHLSCTKSNPAPSILAGGIARIVAHRPLGCIRPAYSNHFYCVLAVLLPCLAPLASPERTVDSSVPAHSLRRNYESLLCLIVVARFEPHLQAHDQAEPEESTQHSNYTPWQTGNVTQSPRPTLALVGRSICVLAIVVRLPLSSLFHAR